MNHSKLVSNAVKQRADRLNSRRPVPYADCWDCLAVLSSSYNSADVTVLCMSRDQHTTNEDNHKAQSIFPTVACIIDDLSLHLEPMGISHRARTGTHARYFLSKLLNTPIHPCKVKVTNKV